MTGAEIIARCQTIAGMSETTGAITRTFLCPAMHDVHRTLRAWMEEAGMTVTLDGAGSLRGLYGGNAPNAARLLIGSHIDTVPNAGAYDGVLGVVWGTAVVRALAGRRLPFAIEVIAFSEEEGVRFGVPFIGSRFVNGTLDSGLLARTDAAGVSVADALRDFGVEPAPRLDAQYIAYMECHIEQGPVLDALDLPLGVVTAIVGQTRAEVRFRGAANHAGTTPMRLRRDALAAAGRWIACVERFARATPGALATVGSIHAYPGAGNVIAGEVLATLDLRHADDGVRHALTSTLRLAAEAIAKSRDLALEWDMRMDQAAVACDTALTEMLSRAVESAGHRVHRLASGAGHDAMIIATMMPVAMLFVRSPGGISHHPDESVRAVDVDAALAAGVAFLCEMEKRHA
ncbi:MAG: allantoate amidohydrolase [Candidatus Solibacter sp.]